MALVNLAEYEARVREILPLPAFDYYYGGGHDEITVIRRAVGQASLRLSTRNSFSSLQKLSRCEPLPHCAG